MSLINVVNLTFAYDGGYHNIFENVSFQLDTNWKLGLIGRNGRGKTTFLKILLGNLEYSGTVSSQCEFEYFPFDLPEKNLPFADIAENICPGYQQWELEKELSLLEVEPESLYRPFNSLSNGEQTKALLAALFLKQDNFLLIDEPTNHLDVHGREVLSRYLKSKKGFILVSHDRAFIDGCVDHILSINKANIEVQRGDFSSWMLNKKRQDSFEQAADAKLRKEVKRLAKAAEEKALWSNKIEKTKFGTRDSGNKPDKGYIGHKSAKMMKRSKSIEHRRQAASEEKAGLLKNIESADTLKLKQLEYHSNRLLALENISIFYGDKPVCRNISMNIEKGERVALCGINGSGKTSLINLICGEVIRYSGNIQKSDRLIISRVSQDTSYLKGGLSEFIRDNQLDESLFKALLHKFDVSKTQFNGVLTDFSEGQKKKVIIAKSLCEQSHLLVWDEPLNYIDVISRMQIENLILEYSPTILFVEHDSAFNDKISTRKISLPRI